MAKISKTKIVRRWYIFTIYQMSDLKTAGFSYLLLHTLYYDVFFCLKYMKTNLATNRCLKGESIIILSLFREERIVFSDTMLSTT